MIRLDDFDTHASQGDGEGKDHGERLAKVDNVIAAYKRGLGNCLGQKYYFNTNRVRKNCCNERHLGN